MIEYFTKSRGHDYVLGFYEINGDNKDSIMKQITGQYVQKELILDIATKSSPTSGVQM
jgi:hypothetical protein